MQAMIKVLRTAHNYIHVVDYIKFKAIVPALISTGTTVPRHIQTIPYGVFNFNSLYASS